MSKSRKNSRKARNRNRKKVRKSLPSMVDLVIGAKSDMIVQASFRTGAGTHEDKRRKKRRKTEWKKDLAE